MWVMIKEIYSEIMMVSACIKYVFGKYVVFRVRTGLSTITVEIAFMMVSSF